MAERNVQGGNFETRFVDVSPKEFDCPICLEVLKNPFAIECCRHHFCNVCINRVKHLKDECPLCKARPIKGALDKHFKQVINGSSVYCSLRSAGCKWTGRYDALSNHLSLGQQNGQCKHVMLNCPHKKCAIPMLRTQIKNHVKNCKYRPFTCPHCGHKGLYVEVVETHYARCSQYPVPCPNKCSAVMKPANLQHHVDSTCPNTMVCCPFLDLGCKAKMKRSEINKHIDSNSGQHRVLVSSTISELRKENKLQKESRLNLIGATSQLEEKVTTLETKCSQLEGDLFSMLHVHEENEAKRSEAVAELCEKNAILESSLSALQSQQCQLQDHLSATCKENKQLKGTVSALESKCASLQTQFDKLKTLLNNTTQQVENKMKKLHSNYEAKLTSLEDQLKQKTSTDGSGWSYDYGDGEDDYDDDDEYVSASYHELENSLQAVEEDNSELRAGLGALEAKHRSLEKKFRNLQDHLITSDEAAASAKQTVLQLLQQLEVKVLSLQSGTQEQSQQGDIDYWMHGYKLIAKSLKNLNWKLYLYSMAEPATQLPEPVSPVIFHLAGYNSAKTNKTALHSSPFFSTGAGKYKFKLTIGMVSDPGYPSYLCVYASLLKGEYDSLLSWPFVGSIYVTLLNQAENSGHYKMAIWLSDSRTSMDVAGRVPSNQNSNRLFGKRQFISMRELERTGQYIANDCLFFKVEATAAKASKSKDCIIS